MNTAIVPLRELQRARNCISTMVTHLHPGYPLVPLRRFIRHFNTSGFFNLLGTGLNTVLHVIGWGLWLVGNVCDPGYRRVYKRGDHGCGVILLSIWVGPIGNKLTLPFPVNTSAESHRCNWSVSLRCQWLLKKINKTKWKTRAIRLYTSSMALALKL